LWRQAPQRHQWELFDLRSDPTCNTAICFHLQLSWQGATTALDFDSATKRLMKIEMSVTGD
jgi:hypothetical protein